MVETTKVRMVKPVQNLCHAEGQSAILRRVASLTPASERRWGRMSVHQMVCHLSDGYRAVLGDRTTVRRRGTLLQRTLIKWIALHTPVPWPKGLPTVPESNQEIGGTRPVEFNRDVSELKRLIERVAGAEKELAGRPHPMFGPLSSQEWGHWAYRHADHHLRQFGV